jgi:hypothetical protein
MALSDEADIPIGEQLRGDREAGRHCRQCPGSLELCCAIAGDLILELAERGAGADLTIIFPGDAPEAS